MLWESCRAIKNFQELHWKTVTSTVFLKACSVYARHNWWDQYSNRPCMGCQRRTLWVLSYRGDTRIYSRKKVDQSRSFSLHSIPSLRENNITVFTCLNSWSQGNCVVQAVIFPHSPRKKVVSAAAKWIFYWSDILQVKRTSMMALEVFEGMIESTSRTLSLLNINLPVPPPVLCLFLLPG